MRWKLPMVSDGLAPKLTGWILGGLTASGWIVCACLIPWHHTSVPIPQLLLVCGGADEHGGGIASYRDCTSRPMELKTTDDCNRAMLAGAWVLSTGPVTRATGGRPIRLTCINRSDLQSRAPEPQKPPAVIS